MKIKTDATVFWATFGTDWAIFISSSGHTVYLD